MCCKYTDSLKFIFRSILIHQTHSGGRLSTAIILKLQNRTGDGNRLGVWIKSDFLTSLSFKGITSLLLYTIN